MRLRESSKHPHPAIWPSFQRLPVLLELPFSRQLWLHLPHIFAMMSADMPGWRQRNSSKLKGLCYNRYDLHGFLWLHNRSNHEVRKFSLYPGLPFTFHIYRAWFSRFAALLNCDGAIATVARPSLVISPMVGYPITIRCTGVLKSRSVADCLLRGLFSFCESLQTTCSMPRCWAGSG